MSVVPSRPAQAGPEALVDVFVRHDLGVVHDVSTTPAYEYSRRLQMATPVADPKKHRERRAERLKLLALDMSSVGTISN